MADKEHLFVVDDFLPDLEPVFEVVKASRYSDASYIGKKFTGVGDVPLPVKPLIEDILGHKIAVSVGILRKGDPTLPITHYIHTDNYDATCVMVLYFNKPCYETGTAFWKHKETGIYRLPDDADQELFDYLTQEIKKPDNWEMTHYVQAKANRAVFFDSRLFHSRYPEHLPLESLHDPRYNMVISYHPLDEKGNVILP